MARNYGERPSSDYKKSIISNQNVRTEKTKEWYKVMRKLATNFGKLITNLRNDTVAKFSIKDVTQLASSLSLLSKNNVFKT